MAKPRSLPKKQESLDPDEWTPAKRKAVKALALSLRDKQKSLDEDHLIPAKLRAIRTLALHVFGKEKGKELIALLKDYYIMDSPVALANYPKSYCYFREGQNSLLRSLEIFAASEAEFMAAMANQMQSPPGTN
jgi:hypothetical protein